VVTFQGSFVWPLINKAELMNISVKKVMLCQRLHLQDDVQVEVTVDFYVRINATREDVLKVATYVGCANAGEDETIRALFVAKFAEALKNVGKHTTCADFISNNEAFKERLFMAIGMDLNGYLLDDLAIGEIRLLRIEELDPLNILEAREIRSIIDSSLASLCAVNFDDVPALAELQAQHQTLIDKIEAHGRTIRAKS
jgi:uncharacterized membrane protein YqiK